jgi:hypothetical protein
VRIAAEISTHGRKLQRTVGNFNARLRKLCVQHDTNKRLPEEFHLSEFDITRLVCGRKNPKPEQAEALAAVLGCPVEEIFPNLGTGGAE